MNWMTTTTRTIDLGYEQLLTFHGRPGTRVRVLYGSMWLTEEGDPRDVFVHCGDEVALSSTGLSVIEGIGAARVQLIEPHVGEPRAPKARLGQRVARLVDALRARRWRGLFARSMLMMLAIAVSATLLHVAVPGPLVMHATPQVAAAQSAPTGAMGLVLDAVASAGVAFLAAN